jgi:hypothetical protein
MMYFFQKLIPLELTIVRKNLNILMNTRFKKYVQTENCSFILCAMFKRLKTSIFFFKFYIQTSDSTGWSKSLWALD